MIARYQWQRLLVAVVVIGVMLLIGWLLDPFSSPLGFDYLIEHVAWVNFFTDLQTIPAFFSTLASGDPHNPSVLVGWVAFLVQWAIVGYLLGMLFFRKPKRR